MNWMELRLKFAKFTSGRVNFCKIIDHAVTVTGLYNFQMVSHEHFTIYHWTTFTQPFDLDFQFK